jgi:hypothetical protein
MGAGGVTISRSVDPSPVVNGSSTSGGGATAQRAIDVATAALGATAPTTPAPAGPEGSHTIRRMTTPGGNGTLDGVSPTDRENGINGNGNGHGGTQAGGATRQPSTTEVLDRVDEMMAHLEERILEELERRGGRFTGSF